MNNTPHPDFLESETKYSASTFRIPPTLRHQFKVWCAERGFSMQVGVVTLIKNAVCRDKYKQPNIPLGSPIENVPSTEHPPKNMDEKPKGVKLVKREPEPTVEEPEPEPVVKHKKSTAVKIR